MDTNIDLGLLNIIDDYIKLKKIQLKSSKQKISLENGWILREIKASTVYGFNIDSEVFNKLDSLNGDYSIEIDSENYTCDIVNLNEKQVDIRIENYNKDIKFCEFLIDLSFIQEKQIQALETFKADNYKTLREQLLGSKELEGGEQVECFYNDAVLNQYQEKAIKLAVGINDFVLIWGPPGTGKTRIVPEIASNFQRIFKNENYIESKILICAWTNTAVDNIVKVLYSNKCDVIRYGKQTTLGQEYKNILFENIVKDYKININKENLEIIKNLSKKISNIEHLISTDNNNLKKLEADISSIKSEILKIDQEIKKKIRDGLEKDVLIQQDSIKQYDKQLEDINHEITDLEIDITKTNDVIKQYDLEFDNLQKNIDILKHRILNQFKIRETAQKYLRFIEQHPIKYRLYYHTGLKHPDFHDELIKYDMQKKDHSTISSQIREIDTKIDDLECQQTEVSTQKKELEHTKEKMKGTLIESISAVSLFKHEISEISGLKEAKNEELQYINEALSSLQNIEVNKYFKNTLLKGKIAKQLQNYEKMQKLIGEQDSLNNERKNIKSELLVKENEVNNFNKELNEVQNDTEIDKKLKNAEVKILKKHNIIATTNLQASKLFETVDFDLTIMDEAGAVDLPGALIPILSAKKLVLLGDHKQLAPIINVNDSFFSVKGKNREKILKSSIFELLFDKVEINKNCLIKLNKQYRMRREISDFISRYYNKLLFRWDEIPGNGNDGLIEYLKEKYDIEWVNSARIEKNKDLEIIKVYTEEKSLSLKLKGNNKQVFVELEDGRNDTLTVETKNDKLNIYDEIKLESDENFDFKLKGIQDDILGSDAPFICFKRDFFSKKVGTSHKSENEMLLIKKIIESYKQECGDKILTKIGVISAYGEQAKLIRNEMKSSGLTIDCSTVHKYQGQEKRIIIYSTARQSSRFLGGEDGWRLLNVAISRAKEKVILIGSDELFRNIPDYADLHRYIKNNNGKISRSDEYTIFDPIVKCKKCGSSMSPAFEFCHECNDIKAIDDAKRTYPEVECDDGINKVRSKDEKIIDDWLYNHGIEHEYEKKLPFHSWCDWYIQCGDVYIEYFGFDSYNNNLHKIERKIQKYKAHNLELIDLYPKDIKKIDTVLSEKMRRYNVLK